MLDFSITEIGLIGLVALVAIGPERLPRVARGAGVLLGRFRRYANTVKSEIDDEIRRSELKELQKRMDEAARDAQQSLQGAANQTNEILKQPLAETGASTANPEASAVAAAPSATPEPPPHHDAAGAAISQPTPVGADHPAIAGGLYLGGDAFVTRSSGPSRSFPIGDLGRATRNEVEVP